MNKSQHDIALEYVDRRYWRFDPVTGEPLEQPDLARVGEIGVWGEQPEPNLKEKANT